VQVQEESIYFVNIDTSPSITLAHYRDIVDALYNLLYLLWVMRLS